MTDREASYWLVCELNRRGVPETDWARLAAAFHYVADMRVADTRRLAEMIVDKRADLLTLPPDQLAEGLAWIFLRGESERITRRAANPAAQLVTTRR